MVRVISEKLFSPPRSRHSSGETLDKELAARAVEALSSLDSRRLDFFSDCESSSDSHWDSEADQDGDSQEFGPRAGQSDGARQGAGGEDIVRKRKERRRERNKLSAQAYRMRRREQSVKQQKVLSTLEEENTRLKQMVESLESELGNVRAAMRHRHASQPEPQPPAGSQQPPVAPQSACSGRSAACSYTDASAGGERNGSQEEAVEAVDNGRMQPGHAGVVDNFLFSKPAHALSSSAVPSAASTTHELSFLTSPSPSLTTVACPRVTTTTDTANNIFSRGSNTGVPLHHLKQYGPHHSLFLDHDHNANTAGLSGTDTSSSYMRQSDNANNNNANIAPTIVTYQQQQHRHRQHNNNNLFTAPPVGSQKTPFGVTQAS